MISGIREILIISTPEDTPSFEKLLGNGNKLGIKIEYKIQQAPRGLADAFILGEEFIGNDSVCLILGDNIFHGQDFVLQLKKSFSIKKGAVVFGYPVKNPKDFGVVEFDSQNNVISIEEKPINPKSNYAVTGLYFYDNSVVDIAKKIKPSKRGEIEITDINNIYLKSGSLKVITLGRGMTWLDTGTPYGMLKASEFVETIQSRQGYYIACIEEVAWRNDYITDQELLKLGENMKYTDYGKYIISLFRDKQVKGIK
jgi:glucose-1-phosphate thymidylyltransferase